MLRERNEDIIHIADKLQARKEEMDRALKELSDFVRILYEQLEFVVRELGKHYDLVGNPTRERLSDGRETLSFRWDDNQMKFIPGSIVALPRFAPKTVLPGPYAQQPATMLALFSRFYEIRGDGYPIYQIYVFPDGAWKPYGIGWEMWEPARIDAQKARDFSVTFLNSLIKDFHSYWRPLHELPPGMDMPGARQRLGFPHHEEDSTEAS